MGCELQLLWRKVGKKDSAPLKSAPTNVDCFPTANRCCQGTLWKGLCLHRLQKANVGLTILRGEVIFGEVDISQTRAGQTL